MVLMHRKDIIEQYGFDPAENSSVVEKGSPTAAINVVPDEQKIEAPSQETPSAGVGQNILAGAVKSVTSDPMMLYGLAGATYYWAKRRLMGDSEGEFADGLYEDGGLQNVRQHVQQKAQELRANNPHWNDAAVQEAVQQYTVSPEFFDFNTSQMVPAVRNSYRFANEVNQKVGVNKLPTQENFIDDTMQTLGGLLTPTGFLKVAGIGEKLLGKAGRIAGHVVEATVVPGTSSYRPAVLGANLAGGMAVDEALRHVQGDPSVLPSGEAIQELFKEQGRRELEAPIYGLTQPGQAGDQPAQLVDQRGQPTQEGGIPYGTIAAGAAIGGALFGARHALSGRIPAQIPNTPARTAAEAFAIRREQDTGLNPPRDPGMIARSVQALDEAMSREAPVENLGTRLGVGNEVRAEMGQMISASGRHNQATNAIERGILPTGAQVQPLRTFFDFSASLPNDVRLRAQEAAQADEILRDLQSKRQRAQDEFLANPNDPAAQQTHALWQAYDPSRRRYRPDLDENALQQMRWRPGQDPNIDQYMQHLTNTNVSVTEMLHEAGIIGDETRTARLADPHHAGLFELSRDTPFVYDPGHQREQSLGAVTQPVFRAESPEVALRAMVDSAIDASSTNIGRRNIVQVLTAADPNGREIRVLRRGEEPGQFGATFTYREGGRDVTVQVARPSVADAIRAAPIDDGAHWNFLNTARQYSQLAMVHGPAAIKQAPVSAFYDMIAGNLTTPSGRSIGYLSQWMRRMAPDSGLMRRSADVVEALDWLTKPVAYASTFGQATVLGAADAAGRLAMRQALTRDGIFGHIANNVPGGIQALERAGAAMSQYYASSWLAHYHRWAEAGPHQMVHDKAFLQRSKRQLINDMRRWENGTPAGVWQSMKSIGQGMNAVLNNVASVHRMAYFSQNLAVEMARHGHIPEQAMRVLAEEARRSTGNLAAQPGNQYLRKAGHALPFTRIAVQSIRHMLHAMTARGPWDTALTIGRIGGLAGAMYASAKMMDELGLTNWFYEDLNDFERTTKLRLMKVDKWIERLTTGKVTIPDNPDEMFYTLSLPPEATVFTSPMLFGLEQFGLINRGSNRGNTSAEKDLLYSAAQAANLGNIPLLGAAAAAAGYKMDIGSVGRGRPPISDLKGPRAFYGDMPSGIATWQNELMKSMFGFTGQLGVQALDAGLQDFKRNQDVMSAASRAWQEGSEAWKESSIPTVPGVWDAHKKVYGFTSMSSEINRMNRVADELMAAFSNEFTAAGAMRGENRRMITNDDVREMLYVTEKVFNAGGMKKYQQLLTQLRDQVNDIGASKAKMSYQQVQKEQEATVKEMRPWFNDMMDMVGDYNALLSDNYGELLKKEGLQPNIDSVAKLVRKYSS